MFEFESFLDKVACIDEFGCSISYKSLNYYSNEFGKIISNRSLIFNLCSNTIESLLGYVSFFKNNHVQLLLDKDLEKDLLNNFIDEYKPRYLWCPLNRCDDFDGKILHKIKSYALFELNDFSDEPLYNELSLLITTSGSTGSPKLVRLSYENVQSNTQSIVDYLKINQNERAITSLPMNYSYGLSVINTHLSVGATVLLTDKSIMQREFWSFLDSQQGTSFAGVPYTYEMLNKLMFFRRKLPYLTTLTQAGGKLNPDLQEKFAKYAFENDKKFIVMYGQSEATARMAYLPFDKCLEKKGSIGVAIPNGLFYLVDDNSNTITKPYTQGQLVYKGKNVSLGYACNREDLNKANTNNYVLYTGDIAQFDEDGFFYIVGRKKRFLKIFGNRVSLDATENLIKSKYQNIECCCIGQDDKMTVFITDESLLKYVKQYVANVTHLNPIAFSVKFIESIPKNDSGKVMYKSLENLFE